MRNTWTYRYGWADGLQTLERCSISITNTAYSISAYSISLYSITWAECSTEETIEEADGVVTRGRDCLLGTRGLAGRSERSGDGVDDAERADRLIVKDPSAESGRQQLVIV